MSFRATLTALFLAVALVPAALVAFLAWRQLSSTLALVNAPGVERSLVASLDVAKTALGRIGDDAWLDSGRLAADPALADGAASLPAARAALARWAARTTLDFAAVYRPGRDERLLPVIELPAARLRAQGVAAPRLTEDEIYGALHGEGIATHGNETVAAVRRLGPPGAVPPRAVLVVGARLPQNTFARVRDVAQAVAAYRELDLYRQGTRRNLILSAALVLGGIALLVLLGAFVLGRVVARPVQRMDAAMQRIAAGDETARVAIGGAGELARLAESLNAMAAELVVQREAASRADRLAAAKAAAEAAAHEIGNAVLPLPFALRRVERLLEARGPLDPAVDRSLRSIDETVEALKQLTGRLAAFASASVLTPRPCAVNAIAELVAEMYGAAEGRVRLKLAADAGEIVADRAQLIRALTNLVKNALEASGPAGVVEIRTARGGTQTSGNDGASADECVTIEVLDEGPGIAADRLATIFQPYTSFKVPRGTGLGLAITAEIAARHGGSVRAENQPEGGARFVLEIPARASAPDARDADGDAVPVDAEIAPVDAPAEPRAAAGGAS